MESETSDEVIRLMIVDDQPLIRRGLAMLLDAEADIEVVGTAKDGQQAIELAAELSPHVIIMDLQMPGVGGVVATREITAQMPDTRIVVLTTFDHDDLVFDAIRAGAHAYLLKDATEAEVLSTVKAVNRGESYLSPSIARKVMSQFRALPVSPEPQQREESPPAATVSNADEQKQAENDIADEVPLTPKEQQVLNLLAEGKTNKQIATEIHLAEGTVKNYVSRIMEKLHAQSRTELAVRAVNRQK